MSQFTDHFICPCCEAEWKSNDEIPILKSLIHHILVSEVQGLKKGFRILPRILPTCHNCGEKVEPIGVYKEEEIDALD